MNSELQARVDEADARLAHSKDALLIASTALNKEINRFGVYRKTILKNTIGRFKKDMQVIGQKVKGGTYSIPYEIKMPKLDEISLNEINYTSAQKWQITENIGKATLAGTNKILDVIAKRKGLNINVNKTSGGNSGIWWLDLAQAAFGIAAAVAEKREQEKTEVARYEAETEKLCRQVDARIKFFNQIQKRINEIISVSEELKKRCSSKLTELESIINDFDIENPVHLSHFQSAMILIKGIGELSKVEILDSNDRLSQSDQQYIINSRQLLTENL